MASLVRAKNATTEALAKPGMLSEKIKNKLLQ